MRTRLHHSFTAAFIFAGCCALPTGLFAQGSLTPPGAPAPTMKSLAQIEPRTAISSLPFTITSAGAYYLTGNLFFSGNTNAITVLADQVVIDLNGFGMFGSPGATAIGVPNSQRLITVRNGTLNYWSVGVNATNASGSTLEKLQCFQAFGNALSVGAHGVVKDCTVINAALSGGGNGIQTGDGSHVIHCTVLNEFNHFSSGIVVGRSCTVDYSTATSNYVGIVTSDGATLKECSILGSQAYGVQAGSGCTISDCTASGNGSTAVLAGTTCSIIGCTAMKNSSGISVSDGCTIKQCTVSSNTVTGLVTGNGCTIADCTATFNTNGIIAASECTIADCTASQNSGDGIQASYSCLIKGNSCASNSRFVQTGGAGIHVLNSGNRIEDNVMNSDQYGIKADGSENLIIRNAARGSGSANYNIAAANMVGIIVSAPSSSSILGNTGGSGLGTTDPSANFSY